MAGFGSQPAGGSPYGVGTPDVQADLGGKPLRIAASNVQSGSRYFDPMLKDYVIGSDGRIEGMDDVQQLVLLAIKTTLGSSAHQSLGQTLRSIDRITSGMDARIAAIIEQSVAHLVNAGLVEPIEIAVELPRPGVVFVRFRWRNLFTGADDETFVPLTR